MERNRNHSTRKQPSRLKRVSNKLKKISKSIKKFIKKLSTRFRKKKDNLDPLLDPRNFKAFDETDDVFQPRTKSDLLFLLKHERQSQINRNRPKPMSRKKSRPVYTDYYNSHPQRVAEKSFRSLHETMRP